MAASSASTPAMFRTPVLRASTQRSSSAKLLLLGVALLVVTLWSGEGFLNASNSVNKLGAMQGPVSSLRLGDRVQPKEPLTISWGGEGAITATVPQSEGVLAGGDVEVIALSPVASGRRMRDVNVMMFNKKSGRGDRSEGFSLRKKFRKCSTLARLATAKGRKIHKRRINSGRKKNINPGDYVNPKMQPTVKLMR
mmetsp:Transcript_8626/g.15499  ORF Transcript_8626/g.15499 Transcript_8626/m.15499 type:complete len:195 (+) Transcript_8626:58-642(+)